MTDARPPSGPFEDLDGHTLDELVDYLDRGRTPLDPGIEASPACRIALAGLERLRLMAGGLLEEDAAVEQKHPDCWMTAVLDRISVEARPGRRFPVPGLPTGTEATVTEGALRGLVRAVGDSVPGLLTGRVRVEPQDSGDRMDLDIEVSMFYGFPIEDTVAEFRRRVVEILPRQAPFTVGRLDVRVKDVVELPGAGAP
jgi:hypothetical protein